MAKTGWLMMRNSKHVNVTPIKSEQYFMDQISKDRKIDTLENIIKTVGGLIFDSY